VTHVATPTKFGRLHVPEPSSSLARLHLAEVARTPIEPVAHQLRAPVLDQENLLAQGVLTDRVVPGAPRVDALGSCVANASTVALSAGLSFDQLDALLVRAAPRMTGNAAEDERFAVWLYNGITDQTGDLSTEWPPTDCGSSGLYACQWLEHQGLIHSHKIAHSAASILSLLQTGPLIVGQPWLNDWMNPDGTGFIDGDGSADALQAAVQSGVAGGHETCWYAIDAIGYDLAGGIDPEKTVIRFRNSWSASWGDGGSGRAHLSTFIALGSYCDFRQFVF
jgi:hypothetical protein